MRPSAIQFSANLSCLFTELDFLDRFGAAARAGFAGVECHFPYDHDKATLAEVALTSCVEVALFNLPAGDWAAGERGIACLPARKAKFQDGVGRAIEYAEALGGTGLNCLAGNSITMRSVRIRVWATRPRRRSRNRVFQPPTRKPFSRNEWS